MIAYESEVDGGDSHIALIRGDISDSDAPVLVRMHAHCLLGDVFGATGCECNRTLKGVAGDDCGGGAGGADLPASDWRFRRRKLASSDF